jgi:hypothetical protein
MHTHMWSHMPYLYCHMFYIICFSPKKELWKENTNLLPSTVNNLIDHWYFLSNFRNCMLHNVSFLWKITISTSRFIQSNYIAAVWNCPFYPMKISSQYTHTNCPHFFHRFYSFRSHFLSFTQPNFHPCKVIYLMFT